MYIAGLLAFIASYWLSQKREEHKLSPSVISYPDYFLWEQGLVPKLVPRLRSWEQGSRSHSTFNKVSYSLVPRPLPDFISQPWRKIGRRPGTITTSRTGNGGLDSYVMWTRFHNDGNVPTQYAASTASDQTLKAFCQQLRTLQVPSC